MEKEKLEKYQEEMAKKRRSFVQARAIIQRGKDAGIPNKYIRIKQDDFESILCPQYHKDTKSFADTIYKRPNFLFDKTYIIIDGGDIDSRKIAGFAILFRMIACDAYVFTYDCGELSGEFQSLNYKGENRNELVKRIQKHQVLLIQEFHAKKFNVHLTDSGLFFDQLLSFRDDYDKPTIFTFSSQLSNGISNSENIIRDDRCGAYLAKLSKADINKNQKILRIRVK